MFQKQLDRTGLKGELHEDIMTKKFPELMMDGNLTFKMHGESVAG